GGTAEAGSTVTVTIGGATYTTIATGGNWSVNLATATPASGTLNLNANGANPVSATATDAAGNTSAPGTQSLTIDTTAPNAPTV
ncbi:Ig-like domain-containing protein, partial [Azospirillum brasilense]|uniref:Ig-like domain-containing protein n=1 Tax=Azospirillum brasilense TaxID=192 RepID=UPI000FEEFF2A